jgi:hypothetical protein
LLSCNKDEQTPAPNESLSDFSLTDPEVGQVALFQRISLRAGDTLARSYPDTLELEITEVAAGYIQVEERLSSGSQSQSGRPAVAFPDRLFTYRLSPKPSSLSIEPASGNNLQTRLFPSLREQAHSLSYQASSYETARVSGQRVLAPYLPVNRTLNVESEQNGQVVNLNHDGRQHGLPGFTFLHNRENGLQLLLEETDLAGNAAGWQRIW